MIISEVDFVRYQSILENLIVYFSEAEKIRLNECVAALFQALSRKNSVANKFVLVAYGGGKDSSYMLAYVRLMQLLLLKEKGETFCLRVSTNRHVGMPQAVMDNISRVYLALGLLEDPLAELLLVDEDEISLFQKDKPIPHAVKMINRKNVLTAGHRTQGEGRPTFCNACNLSMVDSFWKAAQYKNNVDMIITGDSIREQRDYFLWIKKLVNKIENNSTLEKGFRGFMQGIGKISKHYFQEMHGDDSSSIGADKSNAEICNPEFFSIFEYTNYAVDKHWKVITEFLNFEFDDLAFSFTETDCANPALMAHMRGLKAEHVHQRNYEDGIFDYIKFAVRLMVAKKFPDKLIVKVVLRYFEENGIEKMRQKIQQFAEDAYDFTEEQIVCMLFAPFLGQGALLNIYIEREQSDLLPYLSDMHALLAGNASNDDFNLIDKLLSITGLDIETLKMLYASPAMDFKNQTTMVSKILKNDPHKALIKTRNTTSGPIIEEIMSGR